jgi:hypothetical protein
MKFTLFLLSAAAIVNAASGASAVDLGTADEYVILAKTGISTVPSSTIIGDIAVSPIAATAITGFSLTLDSTTTFSTSTQVTGLVKAADYTSPTSSDLTTAVSDMETAYENAKARYHDYHHVVGEIGGETLRPGVHTFDGDVTIIDGDVTFQGTNTPNTDIFIIQTTGSVKQAAGKQVTLAGGALPQNIFWQVAGEVIVEAGAHMEGVLLVKTAVTFKTTSSLNGRILTQTAAVLQIAAITQP